MAVRGYQVSPELLKNSAGRREAIRYLSGFGFQANHTPFQLATQMVQQAGDLKGLTVRVLFNLEFLEVLKDSGVDMARVQFVADTAIEERFARLVFPGVDTVLMDETQWKAAIADPQLLGGLMAKKSMKAADLTLTNPPFNGGVDLKIILAMKDAGLLKRLICVHPSTWLVDVKTQLGPTSGNGNFRKFQNAVREHIKTAELFNGNAVFGIGLFVPCVITDIDFGWQRAKGSWLKVWHVGDKKVHEVRGIDEVTLHGRDWSNVVEPFFKHMQQVCAQQGSLGSNYTTAALSKSKYPVQLANVRGHVVASDIGNMVKDDFYTMTQQNANANKGLNSANPRQLVFDFVRVADTNNFLGYARTDFARLCLSLTKTNQDLDQGQLDFVPWMDFKQSWGDNDLFSHFGYPPGHPIREYAKTFLPDYHGIGKNY